MIKILQQTASPKVKSPLKKLPKQTNQSNRNDSLMKVKNKNVQHQETRLGSTMEGKHNQL